MNIEGEEKISGGALFVKSLLWMGFFLALTLAIGIVVSVILLDFVHGNPHRPKSNAISMMEFDPLLFGAIAMAGVLIVFSLSQAIQGMMMRFLYPRFGRNAYIYIGLAIPLISIITWYCYDYLTPTGTLGIDAGADWAPYQHGITLKRYLLTLVCQGIVTAFSIFNFDVGIRNQSKTSVLLGIVLLTIIVGETLGYRNAMTQINILSAHHGAIQGFVQH